MSSTLTTPLLPISMQTQCWPRPLWAYTHLNTHFHFCVTLLWCCELLRDSCFRVAVLLTMMSELVCVWLLDILVGFAFVGDIMQDSVPQKAQWCTVQWYTRRKESDSKNKKEVSEDGSLPIDSTTLKLYWKWFGKGTKWDSPLGYFISLWLLETSWLYYKEIGKHFVFEFIQLLNKFPWLFVWVLDLVMISLRGGLSCRCLNTAEEMGWDVFKTPSSTLTG